jgi:hypothetical protein
MDAGPAVRVQLPFQAAGFSPPKSGVRLHETRSSSICVAASWLQREHPGTQQFHPDSAVHGSLQGFEPVDLPFGLSITPKFRDGVSDGGRNHERARCPLGVDCGPADRAARPSLRFESTFRFRSYRPPMPNDS